MGRVLVLVFCLLISCAQAEVSLPWYFGDPAVEGVPQAAIDAERLAGLNKQSFIAVAVIDSGVRGDHPSLRGKLLPGVDMVSPERNHRKARSGNFSPDSERDFCPISARAGNLEVFGHGTGVASVISGNGMLGINGINPRVKIVPIKVMGACLASRNDLMDGIRWAAGIHVDGVEDNDHPARIINISMAGGDTSCSPKLQALVDSLIDRGIIIVSAAGNTFGKSAREPSVCSGVISVGAVNPDNSHTYYTAVDERITIYAPGGGAQSSKYGSGIQNKIRIATYDRSGKVAGGKDEGLGTSYSSALVAGVIAGLVMEYPNLNAKSAAEMIHALNTMRDGSNRRNLNYEQMLKLIRINEAYRANL